MITLALDENNKEVLRISASYLLALAGEIDVEIKERRVISDAEAAATLAHDTGARPDSPHILPADEFVDPASVFGEFETAGKLSDDPAPAEVFAPKSPTVAPSIAAVEASTTAPADTMATTLTPPPSAGPSAHVAPLGLPVAHVAPPTVSHAGAVELDAHGLPWDARIHSRERTKIANGNWKNKRGTDPELIKQVETELAAVMSSAPVASPVVTPLPSIAPIAPAPDGIVKTVSPSNVEELTFPLIMKKITTAVTNKLMTATQAQELSVKHGIPSPALLVNRPDLWKYISDELDGILAGGAQS
jgi:hypothetical protein